MKIHAKTQRQEHRDAKGKGTYNHTSSLCFSLRYATPRQDADAGEKHEKYEKIILFSFTYSVLILIPKPTHILVPKPLLGNAAIIQIMSM